MEKKTVTKQANPQPKKYSYEELNNICHQLSEENKALVMRLQERAIEQVFRRLDYLFAVINNADKFGDKFAEFVEKCKKEVVDLMTVPEQIKEEAPKEEK